MQVESLMDSGQENAEAVMGNAREEADALLVSGEEAAGAVMDSAQATASEMVSGGRVPLLPASPLEGLSLLDLLPAAFANVPGAQAQGADAVALLPAATAADSAAAMLGNGAFVFFGVPVPHNRASDRVMSAPYNTVSWSKTYGLCGVGACGPPELACRERMHA